MKKNITTLEINGNIFTGTFPKVKCSDLVFSEKTVGKRTITLSNIPNDGYVYEVDFNCIVDCSNGAQMLIGTSLDSGRSVIQGNGNTHEVYTQCLPMDVGTDRNVHIDIVNANFGWVGIYITGYRKLYKDNSNE